MPSLLTVRAVIFVSPRENRYLLVSLNHVAVYSLNFDKLRDIVHTVSLWPLIFTVPFITLDLFSIIQCNSVISVLY